MPDVNALMNTYFVQAGDATPPTEPVPATFADSKITPLIDCAAYTQAVHDALALVGTGPDAASNPGHFILVANWWLGLSGGDYQPPPGHFSSFGPQVINTDPFRLDGPGGVEVLLNVLKAKAQVGVDVRVMGWISFAIMDSSIAMLSGAGSIARVNALTMQSIKDLRAEPTIGNKAILNVISHTAGAVHAKMVVIGTNTEVIGFTGGIDFDMGRWAHPDHAGSETWHDVVAKVEGPAVQGLYDYFQKMWSENIARSVKRFNFAGEVMPHFMPGVPVLGARPMPLTPRGVHHVQSLRTVPKFNYKWYNCLPENSPISFAPDGLFEFRAAMHKALRNAETYVYMEDQSFWSQDIMLWINDAIKSHASLRVILLASGGSDPNDPAFPVQQILSDSINRGLLKDLTPAQVDQVRMFKRYGDTSVIGTLNTTTVTDQGANSRVETDTTLPDALPANALAGQKVSLQFGIDEFEVVGNEAVPQGGGPLVLIVKNKPGPVLPPAASPASMVKLIGITVHTKSTLIDDHFAIIGSANCMRRSLYTDCEHSVGFVDESDTAVRDYRTALWAGHFRHPTPADLNDIQQALHVWEPTWGTPGAGLFRPAYIDRVTLPLSPELPLDGSEKTRYDSYLDTDSRDPWGGLCP